MLLHHARRRLRRGCRARFLDCCISSQLHIGNACGLQVFYVNAKQLAERQPTKRSSDCIQVEHVVLWRCPRVQGVKIHISGQWCTSKACASLRWVIVGGLEQLCKVGTLGAPWQWLWACCSTTCRSCATLLAHCTKG